MGRQVRVGVEPQDGVGLGQLLGELDAVPLGQAPDGHDRPASGRASSRRSAASSSTSIESFFACSTNPQVLTTATSASAASSTNRQPAASSRPASSSESTSLRAQPNVTRATVREGEPPGVTTAAT